MPGPIINPESIAEEPRDVSLPPTCILLQIDGLSYFVFQKALLRGKLPFLRQLLQKNQATAGPWRSMLPSSTSAFQAGLFYGNNDDIPAFFWWDKSEDRKIKMNRAGDAAVVEADLRERVAPYEGLLKDGSSYSSVFEGGASNSFLTFARLYSPRLTIRRRRDWLLFFVSQLALLGRLAYYSVVEILLAVYDLFRGLISERNKFLEFKFLFPRIASVVFCREIATLAAIFDIYRGVGPVYLNYFAYDEHAHHRGPDSRFAHWSLKGLDASIKRIWKAAERAERLGIRRYDVYVWSDHGQIATIPFHELFGQEPEAHFDLLFKAFHSATPESREEAERRHREETLAHGRIIMGRRPRFDPTRPELQAQEAEKLRPVLPRWIDLLYHKLLRPAHRAEEYHQRKIPVEPERTIRVVSTGPVANLYMTARPEKLSYEDWLESFPEFLEMIASHRGLGFALAARNDGQVMVGCSGHWFPISDDRALNHHASPLVVGILHQRRDEFVRWIHMPSAGDLMLFGQRATNEPVISYSYERGGHAGPSPEETTPFMLVPDRCTDLWPELADGNRPRIELTDLHERLRRHYTEEAAQSDNEIIVSNLSG